MNNLRGFTKIELMIGVAIVVIVLSGIFGSAFGMGGKPPTQKQQQSQAAKEAADSIVFTENAEIENIKSRLELTSDPALLGFVVLLNEMGQPVAYYGVKGKVTSSGKRLTSKQILVKGDKGQNYGDFVMDAPSDEGTHGSSSPYVFFWTTDGQYIQWSGHYLYSDKPFRLNAEPIVVSGVSAE